MVSLYCTVDTTCYLSRSVIMFQVFCSRDTNAMTVAYGTAFSRRLSSSISRSTLVMIMTMEVLHCSFFSLTHEPCHKDVEFPWGKKRKGPMAFGLFT